LAAATLAVSACGDPPLDGFVWDVTLTGEEDLCNDPVVGYQHTLQYFLTFPGGNSVDLATGGSNFATGQIEGCSLFYESVVWGEPRDGFDIRWKITGEAIYQQSGGCETQLPENVDWKGTEVFEIIQSDHPEIPPGCTYTLSAEGVYVGQAE
jgi:hypothetical protein